MEHVTTPLIIYVPGLLPKPEPAIHKEALFRSLIAGVRRLDAQVASRTEGNNVLAARNATLEAEVLNLKQGIAAAEERARTELGMVALDETFYLIAPYQPAD